MARYDLLVGVFNDETLDIDYTPIACDYSDNKDHKRLLLNIAISEGFNPNYTVLQNNFNRVQFYINVKGDNGQILEQYVPLITRVKNGVFI